MQRRENLLSMYHRTGYEKAEYSFSLCPDLVKEFYKRTGSKTNCDQYYDFAVRYLPQGYVKEHDKRIYRKYFSRIVAEDTEIDMWGVGHEKGSEAAAHMTRFVHPMEMFTEPDQIKKYPFPSFDSFDDGTLQTYAEQWKREDYIVGASMEATIWETAWYMRGMENLMMDMMEDSECAEILLDQVTKSACQRAACFAKAGADIICTGDDIGMQRTPLMSVALWRKWIKPRFKKVVDTIKNIKPDTLVQYHSCGFVEPFIEDLIEVGVDILNPIQPESMSFENLHSLYGDRLSFNGTIGTQTTMPFGKPEEVYAITQNNLRIAGNKGGLFCCPTHLLEPEVPYENIEAYIAAVREYKV